MPIRTYKMTLLDAHSMLDTELHKTNNDREAIRSARDENITQCDRANVAYKQEDVRFPLVQNKIHAERCFDAVLDYLRTMKCNFWMRSR